MNKRRALIYGAVFAVLGLLIYLQFQHWRNFDWDKFLEHTRDLAWRNVVYAVVLIYFSYLLRAIRWKIFLQPVRKDATVAELLSPTVVGFTGLALLGRAAELIRPYLIARRTKLSFSSQLAVLVVERIFDVGAFTVLLVSAIFLPTSLRQFAATRPAYDHWLHLTGYFLSAAVAGLFVVAMAIGYRGSAIADWVQERFSHLAEGLGHRIAARIREFSAGLNTIQGPVSFFLLAAVSIGMWWSIALAYSEVAQAYGAVLQEMTVSRVLLLIGSSMVGSVLQLPGVGGGSQLAIIEVLDKVFEVPRELAVSCGILLWLVTFMAIAPAGLILAHRERLSLRKISEEAEHEGEITAILPETPPAA
jgi:uncharacterized protein (TIRG00374 family)